MISLILIGLLAAVFDVYETVGNDYPSFESTPRFDIDPFPIQWTTQPSPLMHSTTIETSDNYLDPFLTALNQGASLNQSPDTFSVDVEAPINTILTFCQSCQNNNTAPVGSNCCMPCDCSDRCYSAGTCCADMTNASLHHRHYLESSSTIADDETCVDAFIIGENYQGLKNHSYLLFQNCTSYKDDQTNLKCLNPDVDKLDEITPVFDRKTNQHYRNMYCSKCNNEAENDVFWNILMTCKTSDILSSSFPQLSRFNKFSIMDFISTNPECALFWEAPLNVKKADRCLSEQNIVSDCNTPILDNLCKQYYAPIIGGDIIFRNVFCMECKYPSKLDGRYEECLSLPDVFDTPPFIAILSVGLGEKMTLEPIVSELNICPSPKRYNVETITCLHHTCAVTEINTDDKCIQVFSQLRNIHLEYRIKLRIGQADMLSTFHQLPFDSDLMAVVGLTEDGSNVCFADILDTASSSESESYDVKVVFIKQVDADKSTIIQQSFNEYVENIQVFNEKAKAKKKTFLLEIDTSDLEPIPEDSVTFVKFLRGNLTYTCKNTIAMTKLQFCDTITFHEEEFEIESNGTVSIDQLIFSPGEYVLRHTNGNIKNVQVCLNDYIFRFKNTQGKNSTTSSGQYDWMSRIIILCLLCAVIAVKFL